MSRNKIDQLLYDLMECVHNDKLVLGATPGGRPHDPDPEIDRLKKEILSLYVQPGAVWVKASEGTPAHDGIVHLKIVGLSRVGNFFDNGLGKGVYVNGPEPYSFGEDKFSEIFWLDETTAAAHERTWGENEYPDLSFATPEQKAETINGLVLLTAREVLKMFLAFGLKTHIECTVINDPTKEEFDFIFRKKRATAGREEEDKKQFDALQSWLSNGGYSFDGEYYYDDENNFFTPDQIWQLFKQQKEK